MNPLFISINLEPVCSGFSLLCNSLVTSLKLQQCPDWMAGLGHDRVDGHCWICSPVPPARGVLGGGETTTKKMPTAGRMFEVECLRSKLPPIHFVDGVCVKNMNLHAWRTHVWHTGILHAKHHYPLVN